MVESMSNSSSDAEQKGHHKLGYHYTARLLKLRSLFQVLVFFCVGGLFWEGFSWFGKVR